MNIHRLSPGDAPRLATLHAGSMEQSWDEKSFSRFLQEKTVTGHGYFDSGVLLGFVLCRAVRDETEILTLAVDGDYRRQGIASALLRETMKESTVFLEVNAENKAALALYRKAGFEPYRRRTGYYQTRDGSKDAILMRRSIT